MLSGSEVGGKRMIHKEMELDGIHGVLSYGLQNPRINTRATLRNQGLDFKYDGPMGTRLEKDFSQKLPQRLRDEFNKKESSRYSLDLENGDNYILLVDDSIKEYSHLSMIVGFGTGIYNSRIQTGICSLMSSIGALPLDPRALSDEDISLYEDLLQTAVEHYSEMVHEGFLRLPGTRH